MTSMSGGSVDLTLQGTSGALRVGYVEAATLHTWKLETMGPSLYRLKGKVERATPVYLAMRPLRLTVRVGALCYAWDVESVECEGTELEAWVQGDPTLGRD